MNQFLEWVCAAGGGWRRRWGPLGLAMALGWAGSAGEVMRFKTRGVAEYEVAPGRVSAQSAEDGKWIAGRAVAGGELEFFGSRVVLRLAGGGEARGVAAAHGVDGVEAWGMGYWILEAGGAPAAAALAERLGALAEVETAYPVMRREARPRGMASLRPDDPLYGAQWHLDARDALGLGAGWDMNFREAWSVTRGGGVVIAVVDDGIDLGHGDLKGNIAAGLSHNFLNGSASGAHMAGAFGHGTAVAGMAAARGFNRVGIAGAAPEAGLASFVIADRSYTSDDALLGAAYAREGARVAVQNHSWGYDTAGLKSLSPLEHAGIEAAHRSGRGGLGTLLVRAAGNSFAEGLNVNDEEQSSDPRFVAVAAVGRDGRATSYSTRGSSILVAAPGGESAEAGGVGLVTTDWSGGLGFNTAVVAGTDSADYVTEADDLYGTSFAAPLISGTLALALSANPSLAARDAQQVLALASRQRGGPDLFAVTNGVGLVASPETGFGVPDAGLAVRLAAGWRPRPALERVAVANESRVAIPQQSPLQLSSPNVVLPLALRAPAFAASGGALNTGPLGPLPLEHVGQALTNLAADLRGKGALIQRGEVFFWEKIERAAAAGAAFAIIYNNVNQTEVFQMGLTRHTPIPAVMIGQVNGEDLRARLAQGQEIRARLAMDDLENAATIRFQVEETLICEHVGLRVRTDHPRRGDLKITLRSPSGTRSTLQYPNTDARQGPVDWVYYSTHHFFEPTAGEWTATVQDQRPSNQGNVVGMELQLRGVRIVDSDRDGLDDGWEREHFGGLAAGPLEDPDGDGWNNGLEQVIGGNPRGAAAGLVATLSRWSGERLRLSWSARAGRHYEVWSGPSVDRVDELEERLEGTPPTGVWFTPAAGAGPRFYRILER